MSAFPADDPVLRRADAPERARDQLLLLRAGTFLALAVFASLAYGELLIHPPAGRMLAVSAIATAGCMTLALPRRDGRPALPAVARPLVLLATLALAVLALGIPSHLLAPAGWGRLSRHVGDGVDGLGAWLWPYRGGSMWPRLAVLLVAPVVLVVAGALCFWPAAAGERVRRTAALALLVGLFLTGAANTPQTEPGLRGLVLLMLIALWLWVPDSDRGGALRAARWLILPALLALSLRPALSSSSAWLAFREPAGAVVAAEASFQWDQTYGPITWPRSEATMFTIAEPHPGLLRVTSLDRFDGLRFLRSDHAPGRARIDLGRGPGRQWRSRATVTIAGLRSRLLVGGDGLPLNLRWLGRGSPSLTREPDGTLVAATILSGGVYTVTTYQPRPSVAQLRRAPRRFPRGYLPYTRFELPSRSASGLIQPRFAAEARTPAPAGGEVGPSAPGRTLASDRSEAARVEASPYGQMFRLARDLAAGAPGSYDVADRIDRYLLANYTYDEHVPQARYPLAAFLFEQRRGYCQQFSGAMTLLLRMDGIPARVASGFKPSVYDPASGTWKVRALDAHSWVEVFFAGIGWIAFDPTPAAPLALPGAAASAKNKSEILGGGSSGGGRAARLGGGAGLIAAGSSAGGGSPGLDFGLAALAALAVLAALALAALWLRGHLRLRRAFSGDGAAAVAELRGALDRAGSPSAHTTLSQLERRMIDAGEDAAGGYVGALRERRYARPDRWLGPRGRAALRRALIRGGSWRTALSLLAWMPPGAMRRRR